MHPLESLSRRFVPRRTGVDGPLGPLELAVMEAIWEAGCPVFVAEVQERLPPEPGVAYNTVKTTMERLARKGILGRARWGKAYRYTPLLDRGDLERRIVSAELDRLVEQFPEAVASFFVEPTPTLSEEKLLLLQEALERRREEQDA